MEELLPMLAGCLLAALLVKIPLLAGFDPDERLFTQAYRYHRLCRTIALSFPCGKDKTGYRGISLLVYAVGTLYQPAAGGGVIRFCWPIFICRWCSGHLWVDIYRVRSERSRATDRLHPLQWRPGHPDSAYPDCWGITGSPSDSSPPLTCI